MSYALEIQIQISLDKSSCFQITQRLYCKIVPSIIDNKFQSQTKTRMFLFTFRTSEAYTAPLLNYSAEKLTPVPLLPDQIPQRDLVVFNKETLRMFKLSYITQSPGESHSDDLYAKRGINNLWCGESRFLNTVRHPMIDIVDVWVRRCLFGLRTNFNRNSRLLFDSEIFVINGV